MSTQEINQEAAIYQTRMNTESTTSIAQYQFSTIELKQIRQDLLISLSTTQSKVTETNINTINSILAARNSRG